MSEKEPHLRLVGPEEKPSDEEVEETRRAIREVIQKSVESNEKVFPQIFVEVLVLSISKYSHQSEFERFCARVGYNLEPFFEWVRQNAGKEPLYLQKTRYLLLKTFMLLCEEEEFEWEEFIPLIGMPFTIANGEEMSFARDLAGAVQNHLGK